MSKDFDFLKEMSDTLDKQLKDMSYIEAFFKHNLPPSSDIDKDGVINILDCRPFDPNRDGLFGRAVGIMSFGKYGQTKEEYEKEKLDKRPQGVKPVEKRDKEFLDNLSKELTKTSKPPSKVPSSKISQLEERNKLLKEKINPLRLQIEYEKLLMKKQQMEFRKRISPSPRKQQGIAAGFMAGLFGLSAGGMPPFQREGYHIEFRPKLPKDYRWVKAKKKPEGGLPYTEHKYARPQDAEKLQRETYRNYGYMPRIVSVFDRRTGMPFFVVIKPKGVRKVKK